MTRHRNFVFNPGDYVFLHIPILQKYEWHPFTISSSPDDDATISCHIRTLGDWTKSLYKFFEARKGEQMVDNFRVEQTEKTTSKSNNPAESGPTVMRVRRRSTSSIRATPTLEKINEAENERTVTDVIRPVRQPGEARQKPPGYCQVTGLCSAQEKLEELRRQETLLMIEDEVQEDVIYTKKENVSDRRKLYHNSRDSTWKSKSIRHSISTQTSCDLNTNEINIVSKISDDAEKLRVYIDGPYATQSCRVFETDHAVLVATGIGVTPFASILYSILHRYRNSKSTCPSCNYTWLNGKLRYLNRLKKVDFIWINRDSKSFEWFVGLLTQLEHQQQETVFSDFLTIHLYMTSQPHKDDTRDLALQMALDRMCHQDTGDVITGLKTRTKIGRPNWEELMLSIKKKRTGKVKVFFCGPTVLANTIKLHAQNCGFLFCKEIF
ncbi:NADPH oxidase 5-like [Antedon mediterranea]|uniref:NADPH oxidase 5-like n=1 Tax=Antedon mediterranea TaxID=105859 RepID=UPI003AF418C6